MPQLRHAFEVEGFSGVKTVLASGNLLFEAPKASAASLERRAEAALLKSVGKAFLTIVRTEDSLRELVASNPYEGLNVAPNAKRIVTFIRNPPASLKLPITQDGACVLRLAGHDLFTAYLPNAKGPVFMKLIDRAVGKEQTSRTWQTLEKLASL
jgi:uncharacterized protein (DUF1697 family)